MLPAQVVAWLALAAPASPATTKSTPEVPAHSFGIGAQVELISPNFGISAAVAAYDVGWSEWEVSVGLGIFEQGQNALQPKNVYGLGLRVYFPVHRAERADFSLGGGVAINLLDDPNTGLSTATAVVLGAKIRIFVVPNVALVGTLGAGALFQNQGSALIVGARPLGSAGFTYYFR
jgi:hypothetical protein